MNYPLIKPKYYIQLFAEILSFIKNPKVERDLNKPVRLKIYDTIGLYVLKMVCLIPVVLFFAVVYDPENVVESKMADRFTPVMFLVVGGFVLPLIEEVAFRLSLRFRPIYLALSLSVFLYYILTKFVFFTKISAIDDSFFLRILIAGGFGVFIFLMSNYKAVKLILEAFWIDYFRPIYYLSCIVFAWIHINKYEIEFLNILLLPILTLPQLMSGIINGYTRVVFGFQYPLLFHMANNVVGIGLSVLLTGD